MKRIWVLIGSFVLGAPIGSFADSVKPVVPAKVEESTPEQDKAALEAASSDADKWAASHKDKPAASPPVDTTTAPAQASPAAVNAVAPPPAPAPAQAPAAKSSDQPVKPTPPHRTDLNEMKGKLLSIGSDPKSLRLIVDGGYNVEFTFDTQTTVVNGGEPVKIDDLGYNDVLVVRYSGKELYAIEIERISKAPRPE